MQLLYDTMKIIMSRHYDSVDIFFIVIISIYLIALFFFLSIIVSDKLNKYLIDNKIIVKKQPIKNNKPFKLKLPKMSLNFSTIPKQKLNYSQNKKVTKPEPTNLIVNPNYKYNYSYIRNNPN